MSDEGHEDKKLSVFNAGVAKAIRLDNIITRYNNACESPFCYDYELHSYNYKIMLNALRRLFMEAIGKADENEKKRCKQKIIALEYFMEKYPIVEKDSTNKDKVIINQTNWNTFKEHLDELEEEVRIVLDEHDLDTPTKTKYMGL